MTEHDCQAAKAHVHEFLQQELSEQEMVEIHAHVVHCEDCEQTYDFEEMFNQVVKRSCTDSTPQELAESILVKIRAVLDEKHQAN